MTALLNRSRETRMRCVTAAMTSFCLRRRSHSVAVKLSEAHGLFPNYGDRVSKEFLGWDANTLRLRVASQGMAEMKANIYKE